MAYTIRARTVAAASGRGRRTLRVAKKQSKPTVARLVKNVRYLNRAVKGETKYFDVNPPEGAISAVSQCFADSTGVLDKGWTMIDVTPEPNQGTGDNERVGNQIKLKSMQFRLQGSQQKALSCAMKLKIQFIRVKGSPVDVTSFASQQAVMARLYEKNTMSQFTDYHSIRNTSFFPEFEVLATKHVYCAPDQIRIEATGQYMAQICDAEVNKKIARAVRWDTYNSEDISNGQILMIILASTGNRGPNDITGTYPALFNPQANSGLFYTYSVRWNYTDK